MTLDELKLIRLDLVEVAYKGDLQERYIAKLERTIDILDREIKLKEMDPRKAEDND